MPWGGNGIPGGSEEEQERDDKQKRSEAKQKLRETYFGLVVQARIIAGIEHGEVGIKASLRLADIMVHELDKK